MTDPFDEHLDRWRAWTQAPWGRIRFAVVRRTLAEQVAALGPAPLRVLDVGGGDGRDSIPLALDGHDVTVVDTAPRMLQEAQTRAAAAGVADRVRTLVASVEDDLAERAGAGYDLVLCHFLLHYRPAGAGDVARLAALLRPGGRLSLIAPNPHHRVVQRLLREGPAQALEELGTEEWHTATFGHVGRKLPREEVEADVAAAGLRTVGDYGGRIANDLLADDGPKHDPAYYADLERLELALCDRDPYRRFGMFWQLVAERPVKVTP